MDSKYVVSINPKLYDAITNKILESPNEFNDVEEYVNFVLTEVLNDDDEMKDEETKKVEYELKKLGYI